jgi:hypothetical protein
MLERLKLHHGIHTFRVIITTTHARHASEPKDFVYGYLGLVSPDVRSCITKEYGPNWSTANVFAEAVRLCSSPWAQYDVEEMPNFWAKMMENDFWANRDRLAGLPSWCPDLRSKTSDRVELAKVPEGKEFVSEATRTRWKHGSINFQAMNLLTIGLYVDTIADVACMAPDVYHNLEWQQRKDWPNSEKRMQGTSRWSYE